MDVEQCCDLMERNMRGGFSSVLVLYAISSSSRPIHGYSLIRRISERTGGAISLRAGTVYPILRNLEEGGLVSHSVERSDRGPQRKVYSLTEEGREAVNRFDGVVDDFLDAVSRMRA
jgi:PadR family transcriptional regulator PadR